MHIAVQTKSKRLTTKGLLTEREKEILYMIAFEFSSKEVSECIHISIETVKTHRKNIMTKLKVKNTAGMIRAGFEQGIINIKD